ncbi:MAG TPA: thiol reductant ABC exporter subunit CydC [Ktedonobacteraceae bacterium]
MKTFPRLLAFLSPFRWRIALAICLGSIMIASSIGLFGMAAYLIAAAALGPLLVFLSIPIYLVQTMGVVRATSRYTERLVSHNTTFRLLARLRVWAYRRIEPQAPAHLLAHRSGDMLTRLVADIEELQNFYLRVVSPLVVALVISLLTFAIFSIFSIGMAWVSLAFLGLAGLGVPCLSASLARGLGQQQVRARAELTIQVVDGLQGARDVLAFGRSHAHLESVAACNHALGQAQRHMARVTGLQMALGDLFMNTAMWVLLLMAIPLVATGNIDGVYLGAIGLLMLASFEAVQPLASAFQSLGHIRASATRVFAVTDTPPPVTESAAPQAIPVQPAGYSLSFEHTSFAYQAGEREVLSDISFDLRPGSRVAVVGPSGAGKSTLARLALRFWDPASGAICLNGQDIRDLRLHDLRDCIAVVAQDTHLFNDTLRANLLLARPKASEAEIEAAVEQAQLTDFVRQLPQGLKTRVDEQGLRLSGGERQRLAIARAFLKNAPILILDEATANLDPLIERALLDTLRELARGHTTLHITHRLLMMEQMDEILVLYRGRIVERGTHDELLAMGKLYRQLFDAQQGVLTFSAEMS